MSLLGLPWSILLPLGGAFAAVTVGLYILKLRRRAVAVPFSPLWERLLKDRESSQLFSQLKRWLSLLLQLVLLALLLLGLGDPRLTDQITAGRRVVVLIDTSASMAATDVLPSRLGVAQAKLHELLAGLSGADQVLLTKVDATVSPITAMTSNLGVLQRALNGLAVSDTRADFTRGLRFASDALQGIPNGEIIVVSDGAKLELPTLPAELAGLKLSYVAVGEHEHNVAITNFSVRRYPLDRSRHEVMLELLNTADTPAQVELALASEGEVIELSQLSLKPRERLSRFYRDLAGADRRLEATLSPVGGTQDFLAADNRAYALVPERTRAKILVVSAGNTYLEAALLLDEYLQVQSVRPGDALPAGPFDVTIADGVAPALQPVHGAVLYLNPPADGAPVPLRRPIEDFGFDTWDRKSDVLRHLAPENIQVAQGFALEPERTDKVLGASVLGPILVEGQRQGQRFIQTGFDPRHSDFVLRVAWPLFVLNVIHHFVRDEAGYLSSYATGKVWNIPVDREATRAELSGPAGLSASLAVREGNAVFFGEHAGMYELVSLAQDRTLATQRFAANLSDSRESEIAPEPALSAVGSEEASPEPFRSGIGQRLWIYLLAAAVALSVVEWFTYHRRVTV